MLLTICMREVMDGAAERFACLGRDVGAAAETDPEKKAAGKFLDKLKEICDICQVPTLREYGIPEEEYLKSIDKMTMDALASGSPGNCRKKVTEETIKRIYKEAFS